MKCLLSELFIDSYPSSDVVNNEKLILYYRIYQFCSITQLLLMGDFNYPEISWSFSTVPGSVSSPVMVFQTHVKMFFLFSMCRILLDVGVINVHLYWTWCLPLALMLLIISLIWLHQDVVVMTCYCGTIGVGISQPHKCQQLTHGGITLEVDM